MSTAPRPQAVDGPVDNLRKVDNLRTCETVAEVREDGRARPGVRRPKPGP